jgi:hypothetical protein
LADRLGRAHGNKEGLLEELHFLSDKINTSIWTLNLGMLAFAWSLLIASGDMRFTVRNAIWIFVPCLLALLFHMAQYIFGYIVARRLCLEMEEKDRTEFQYPTDDIGYKARDVAFRCKIGLTIIASLILVYTLVMKVV